MAKKSKKYKENLYWISFANEKKNIARTFMVLAESKVEAEEAAFKLVASDPEHEDWEFLLADYYNEHYNVDGTRVYIFQSDRTLMTKADKKFLKELEKKDRKEAEERARKEREELEKCYRDIPSRSKKVKK